jgi:hypothetical protein
VQLTELLNSSRDILSAAYARGLCLRLVGSIGIAQRCYRQIDYARLPLRRWKDIDLVCRQYDYAGVRSLLISRGFAVDLTIEVATEGRRAFFEGKRFSVDLFVDELEFCHRLPLKQRLSVDPVTIPAADLLLSKLQRVKTELP